MFTKRVKEFELPVLHKCVCGKEAEYKDKDSLYRTCICCSDPECPLGYSAVLQDTFQHCYMDCAIKWNQQMRNSSKLIDDTIEVLRKQIQNYEREIEFINRWKDRLGACYMGFGIDTIFRLNSEDRDNLTVVRERKIKENKKRIHELVLLSVKAWEEND